MKRDIEDLKRTIQNTEYTIERLSQFRKIPGRVQRETANAISDAREVVQRANEELRRLLEREEKTSYINSLNSQIVAFG